MADVRAFTGFIAVDGSTHDTKKSAVARSTEVKVRNALNDFTASIVSEEAPPDETLADFLYRHRGAIQAAFSQTVQLRASPKGPRKPRKSKAEPPTAGQVLAGD